MIIGNTGLILPRPSGSGTTRFAREDGTWAEGVAQTAGLSAVAWLAETVTSGSQADVTFSSISASYRDLELRIRGRGTAVAVASNLLMQFNGDTAGNYHFEDSHVTHTSGTNSETRSTTSIEIGEIAAASATANYISAQHVNIYDYRGTAWFKMVHSASMASLGAGAVTQQVGNWSGAWISTAAITSIKLFPSAGAWADGSVISLYGRM